MLSGVLFNTSLNNYIPLAEKGYRFILIGDYPNTANITAYVFRLPIVYYYSLISLCDR